MIAEEIAATRDPTDAPARPGARGIWESLRVAGIVRQLDENLAKASGASTETDCWQVVQAVVTMATDNPWYGYKRIAVMCRRAGHAVKDREAYVVMRDHRCCKSRGSVQPNSIRLHGSSSCCRSSRTIFGRWMSPTSTSLAMVGGTRSQ